MGNSGHRDRAEDRAELFRRAEAHRQRGEYDEQLALLDRIIHVDPQWRGAHFAKGWTLATMGRLQEAEASLRTCFRLNPRDSAGRILLARIRDQLGDEREAEAILRSLVEEQLEPIAEVNVRSDLARVLGRSERSEEALPHVEQAIAIAERADIPILAAERPALLHLQALLLFNVKRTREAVQCLERVVGLSPDNGRYWYGLACGYSLLQRANDAFNTLARACDLDPSWRGRAKEDADFAFLRARDAARFAEITADAPPKEEEEELGRNILNEVKHAPRIFISYRRADAGDAARNVKRRLEERDRRLRVFLDEVSLEPAAQFSEQLAGEIERAHVVLALISPFWQTREGSARIKDPSDVVHREIAWAFRHRVSVVPVLVERARMPAPETLPSDIRALTSTQALTLRSARSEADLDSLASAVERIFADWIARKKVPRGEGGAIYTGVQLPPIYNIKSRGTEGVPLAPFEQWYGSWESCAREAATEFIVRFTTEVRDGGRFAGTFEEVVRGQRQGEQPIQGVWGVAQDDESHLIVGMILDFTIGSRSQQALLPFHRKVGDAYVGTSQDGREHVTRNRRPMPEGF